MNPVNASLALDLILGLLDRASAIGALLTKAKAENRDVTDEELDGLVAEDDVAKAKLAEAIVKARG